MVKLWLKKQVSFYIYVKDNCIIAIIEGISVLKEIIFGTMKIRKTLKPLDEIARNCKQT